MAKSLSFRLMFLMISLGVVLTVALAQFGGKVAVGAPAQPKDDRIRWELAELRVSNHPYWNVAQTGEPAPKQEIVLSLVNKVHKAETFAALSGPLGKAPQDENPVDALNILGREGWEPVSHSATEWVNPGRAIKRVEVWTLKRHAESK